jgi:hypothetical protein
VVVAWTCFFFFVWSFSCKHVVDFLGESGKNRRENVVGHAFSSRAIVSWCHVCVHPPSSGVYTHGVDLRVWPVALVCSTMENDSSCW